MIGSIKERNSSGAAPPDPSVQGVGFPKAEHRSKKSAFLQNRQNASDSRPISAAQLTNSRLPEDKISDSYPSISLEQVTPAMNFPPNDADMISQISCENGRQVEAMREEERESKRNEVLARFGPGIAERLRKAREAQLHAAATQVLGSSRDEAAKRTSTPVPASQQVSDLRESESRPMTPNTLKRLRFADVKDTDIYVYESQPPSPKKRPLALLPPPDEKDRDDSIVSLPARGSGLPVRLRENSAYIDTVLNDDVEEEGTPEDIRRRFFPSESPHDPSLEWMDSKSASAGTDNPNMLSSIRFDLSGNPIPPHLTTALPTHLGLHHHGTSADLAGYTIHDLFVLSRSTVPAQRTAVLEVLAGLLRNLRNGETEKGIPLDRPLMECKGDLRESITAVGAHAFVDGKGTTVIRAIDVLWEGLVGWDPLFLTWVQSEEVMIEMESGQSLSSSNSAASPATRPWEISSLPLQRILSVSSNYLNVLHSSLPPSSLSRLVHILLRVAIHSRTYAAQLIRTDGLVQGIIACFITRPLSFFSPSSASSPQDHSDLKPDHFAIRILDVLAQSDRGAANSLVDIGVGDSLLRVIIVISSAIFESKVDNGSYSLGCLLISAVLRFYRTLGKYGILAHLPSSASEVFSNLGRFILTLPNSTPDPESKSPIVVELEEEEIRLKSAWLRLLEIWMTCARDPHCTSPPHAIRWSQVVAWNWEQDVYSLRDSTLLVTSAPMPSNKATCRDELLAPSLWSSLAAWLEGAETNAVRGGEAEKVEAIERLSASFKSGSEKAILDRALTALETGVASRSSSFSAPEAATDFGALRRAAELVQSAVRLCYALLPKSALNSNSESPKSPHQYTAPGSMPIGFPIDRIHNIFPQILDYILLSKHSTNIGDRRSSITIRAFTSFLISASHLFRILELGTSFEWISSALRIVSCLLPGDERLGAWVVSAALDAVVPDTVTQLGWKIPKEVWDQGGLSIIAHFLQHAFLAGDEPSTMDEVDEDGETPMVPVNLAPYIATPRSILSTTRIVYPADPTMAREERPSDAFKFGLPISADWVFAPLDALLRSGSSKAFATLPRQWSYSETEIVRATLIFAALFNDVNAARNGLELDHVQVIFACFQIYMLEDGQKQEDSAEEVYRDAFVSNAMMSLLSCSRASSLASPPSQPRSLEAVSRRFLGPTTPFYQMYTDFIALYDAISFSDQLFGALLIPPLAMSYSKDYRKLLWTDYMHIIRTIRTEPTHPVIVAESLEEFLWPVEDDGQLVNAYVGALCRTGGVHGVLRKIAIHHVACHIWPDLDAFAKNSTLSPLPSEEESTPEDPPVISWDEERAKKLLALLIRAPHDVVRDVILYNGRRNTYEDVSVKSIPALTNETRAERMGYIALWRGAAVQGQFYALLKAIPK